MTEAFEAAPSVVPPRYWGREQAWIKHQLLESYLEKLMLIVCMAAKRQGTIEICYVDCFSGPWGTSELESTSIAVSLRANPHLERTRCIHIFLHRSKGLEVDWN